MTVSESDCQKFRTELTDLVKMSSDLAIIDKTNWTPDKVNAYKIFKQHQSYQSCLKVIFKIISEITAISGAIVAVVNIFSPII